MQKGRQIASPACGGIAMTIAAFLHPSPFNSRPPSLRWSDQEGKEEGKERLKQSHERQVQFKITDLFIRNRGAAYQTADFKKNVPPKTLRRRLKNLPAGRQAAIPKQVKEESDG